MIWQPNLPTEAMMFVLVGEAVIMGSEDSLQRRSDPAPVASGRSAILTSRGQEFLVHFLSNCVGKDQSFEKALTAVAKLSP
jgi:hypothetical protein